jgi:dephospho-CoA kinase
MLAVALTGGIGSGKTTVADRFAVLGAGLVDADVIAHELTAPGGAAIAAITTAFGASVIAADGSLDRAVMRERAFAAPDERRRLEAILHPMIQRASAQRAATIAPHHPYLLHVIPLLAESARARDRFDRILVVDCDPEVQVERVVARSGLPESQVRAIMAAQASRSDRLAIADDVLDNSNGIDALAMPILRLHERYIDEAARRSAKPLV